jgi:hypothetical protein
VFQLAQLRDVLHCYQPFQACFLRDKLAIAQYNLTSKSFGDVPMESTGSHASQSIVSCAPVSAPVLKTPLSAIWCPARLFQQNAWPTIPSTGLRVLRVDWHADNHINRCGPSITRPLPPTPLSNSCSGGCILACACSRAVSCPALSR